MRSLALCVCALLLTACQRVGAVRYGDRGRHGARRVERGRSGGEGHADRRRNRHLGRQDVGRRTAAIEFPAVKPGIYVVTAEKTGFALALVDNVQVQVGARLRVDLQMPVGQVTEKVEVTASSPLVETDSSQRGQVISGDQTRALPLISREYSVAGAAHDRRQARRVVADDRQHAARGRLQRQRPAQHRSTTS